MPFGTQSAWQYSRWVANIARNSRITEPTGANLAFIQVFLWVIGDPNNPFVLRPWLKDKFYRASVCATSEYDFDITKEPTYVLIKMLDVVGRDFKKIPITDYEALGADILISLSNNRRYGTTPYFGGVSGSTVAIV